jgi:hypothetical protein
MDPLLVLGVDQTASRSQAYWFNVEKQEIELANLTPLDDEHFQKTHALFRIRGHLDMGFEHFDQQGLLFKLLVLVRYC